MDAKLLLRETVILLLTLVHMVHAECDEVTVRVCMKAIKGKAETGSGVFQPVDMETFEKTCTSFSSARDCLWENMKSCGSSHFGFYGSSCFEENMEECGALNVDWTVLNNTFQYLCSNEGKQEIREYNPCHEMPELQEEAAACNLTFQAESERLKTDQAYSGEQLQSDLCRVTNTYVRCNLDAIRQYCDEGAAEWNGRVMKLALEPTMSGCIISTEKVEPSTTTEPETETDETTGCSSVRLSLMVLLVSTLAYVIVL